MTVMWASQLFWEEQYSLSYSKTIVQEEKEKGRLDCIVRFWSTALIDYQKDMFLDTISEMYNFLQQDRLTLETIKVMFEEQLQLLNVKLAAFAEKMKDKSPFCIDGVLQIFWWNEYIAWLVGQTSVVILRNNHVHYRVCQWVSEPRPTIDRFNELLEWELKEGDELITTGVTLEIYLDKTDMQTVIEQSAIEEIPVKEVLFSLLKTRIQAEKIGFLSSYTVEEAPLFSEYRIGRRFLKLRSSVWIKFSYFKRFQALALYFSAWLLGLIMLTRIIDSFFASVNQWFSTDQWGVVVNLSIESIQKDIATFKRIDHSSDQKIKKYNEIIAQLDLLEKNNKRTVDVKKLRTILEKDYLDGFNIESINDLTEKMQLVYTFTQQEKNTLGSLQQLFWNKGLFIVGKEWALVSAVDNQVRGTLVSAGTQRKINVCDMNLMKNGLYCAMTDGNVFNILRAWLQPMTTQETNFLPNIQWVSSFWNNYFYTLTAGTGAGSGTNSSLVITRYARKSPSQENFGAGTSYALQPDPKLTKALSGMHQMVVDGSFLLRSPTSRSLWQLWRPGAEAKLVAREVPMEWGDKMRAPGVQSRVFSFVETRFVYIWDPETQIFNVYRSSPFKTNDAHTTDYKLPYFFSIKFTLGDQKIIDVFVEEGEKANLYVMTATEVRKISLDELRNTFFAKEEENAKKKELGING